MPAVAASRRPYHAETSRSIPAASVIFPISGRNYREQPRELRRPCDETAHGPLRIHHKTFPTICHFLSFSTVTGL